MITMVPNPMLELRTTWLSPPPVTQAKCSRVEISNPSKPFRKRYSRQRGEEDLAQHVTIERHPEPEDEPPAGDGQHETDPAAQDTALPHVVTAAVA